MRSDQVELPDRETWQEVMRCYSVDRRLNQRQLATMWQRLWNAYTGECAPTVTVVQMRMLGRLRDELGIRKVAEVAGNWAAYVNHVKDKDGMMRGPDDPNLKYLSVHLAAAVTFKAPTEEAGEAEELKVKNYKTAW